MISSDMIYYRWFQSWKNALEFFTCQAFNIFWILSCSFDFCSIYHNLVMKSSFGKSAQKKGAKDHTCPLFCTIPFNSTTILIERNVLHLEMSSGIIFCCCSFQRRASSISLLTALTPPHWTPLKNGSSWW